MANIYIGIDPGANGGIAVINKSEDTYSCDVYSNETLITLCAAITYEKTICCLEKVHAMSGQGVTSMFNFGQRYGYIKGVLEAFRIPYQEITPQKWKKEFGLNSSKVKSVTVCKQLFPHADLMATPRSTKPHDGMAEALLMAEYARRRL